MSAQTTTAGRNNAFKVGWIALLVISALATLNHIALAFFLPDEATLFIGWAAFTAYCFVMFYIPFRRGERWAWYASWVMVIGFASLVFFDSQVGVYYAGAAVLIALCLLLTRPAFFSTRG